MAMSSSSSSSSEISEEYERIIYNRYRFSGYNLPMLQLDSTGPAYYYIPIPHPDFSHQPAYYQKPMGYGGGAPVVISSTVSPVSPAPKFKQTKGGLYPLE